MSRFMVDLNYLFWSSLYSGQTEYILQLAVEAQIHRRNYMSSRIFSAIENIKWDIHRRNYMHIHSTLYIYSTYCSSFSVYTYQKEICITHSCTYLNNLQQLCIQVTTMILSHVISNLTNKTLKYTIQ